ncbi:MAG: hemolysin secretion protein [Caulobacter sp.]|nr:hemolysin secretion protein [Caulobacter sp.]
MTDARLSDPAPVPAEAPSAPVGTADPTTAPPPPPRRRWVSVVMALVGVIGVLIVLYAWRLPPFTSAVQATDNAYVRGQVTVISPQVSGYVTAVAVQDYQEVKAGQLLVQVDDRIFRQKVEQARAALAAQQATLANSKQTQGTAVAGVGQVDARIASARAALVQAQATQRRTATLRREGWVAQAQLETANTAVQAAQASLAEAQAARTAATTGVTSAVVGRDTLAANVQAAEATLKLAEIDLANTRIVAPVDGRLGEVGVRQGQYVTAGTQLMSLVPRQVWVIANMKETQMARVRVGQPVVLKVDALNHATVKGHVERISPAAGSEFSVIRPDNATGNFTKVAQRIPVRISIDPGQGLTPNLRPGMSVEARIDTKGG